MAQPLHQLVCRFHGEAASIATSFESRLKQLSAQYEAHIAECVTAMKADQPIPDVPVSMDAHPPTAARPYLDLRAEIRYASQLQQQATSPTGDLLKMPRWNLGSSASVGSLCDPGPSARDRLASFTGKASMASEVSSAAPRPVVTSPIGRSLSDLSPDRKRSAFCLAAAAPAMEGPHCAAMRRSHSAAALTDSSRITAETVSRIPTPFRGLQQSRSGLLGRNVSKIVHLFEAMETSGSGSAKRTNSQQRAGTPPAPMPGCGIAAPPPPFFLPGQGEHGRVGLLEAAWARSMPQSTPHVVPPAVELEAQHEPHQVHSAPTAPREIEPLPHVTAAPCIGLIEPPTGVTTPSVPVAKDAERQTPTPARKNRRSATSGWDPMMSPEVLEAPIETPASDPSALGPLAPWQLYRQLPLLEVKRAEDNYEISERDETEDHEGEMAEPDRSHKVSPKWCETYLQALENQSTLDPDTIFGVKVPRCDLEVIFPNTLYERCRQQRPRRKRGSSGQWADDRLRNDEIERYKNKMGHTETWQTMDA